MSEVDSTCSKTASSNFLLQPLNAFLDFKELSDLPENAGVFLAHKKVLGQKHGLTTYRNKPYNL